MWRYYMKKIFILINIIIVLFVFTSCSNTSESLRDNTAVASIEPNTIQQMTLLVDHHIDIDKDGKDERVEMYTSATKDDEGNMMWDDKNEWLLMFVKDNNTIKLFEGDIQLGKIDFWLYSDNTDKFHVASMITQGESIQMTDYCYDADKGSFTSSEAFSIRDINIKFYY